MTGRAASGLAEALDDLASSIDAVEEALDAGEEPTLPSFVPEGLSGSVTREDLERYEHVMARLQVCQSRIQAEQVEVLEELSGLGRRRTAATAYAAHG